MRRPGRARSPRTRAPAARWSERHGRVRTSFRGDVRERHCAQPYRRSPAAGRPAAAGYGRGAPRDRRRGPGRPVPASRRRTGWRSIRWYGAVAGGATSSRGWRPPAATTSRIGGPAQSSDRRHERPDPGQQRRLARRGAAGCTVSLDCVIGRRRRLVYGVRRRHDGRVDVLRLLRRLLVGLLRLVRHELRLRDRHPGAVGDVHLDPGVDVLAAYAAVGFRAGAEDDPGRDAEIVGDQRVHGGVLLVVADQLRPVDERGEPAEAVTGQVLRLVDAAVAVGAVVAQVVGDGLELRGQPGRARRSRWRCARRAATARSR